VDITVGGIQQQTPELIINEPQARSRFAMRDPSMAIAMRRAPARAMNDARGTALVAGTPAMREAWRSWLSMSTERRDVEAASCPSE